MTRQQHEQLQRWLGRRAKAQVHTYPPPPCIRLAVGSVKPSYTVLYQELLGQQNRDMRAFFVQTDEKGFGLLAI